MIRLRKAAGRCVLDLLEAQHEALLCGNLKVLGDMAPELERAFARLGRERAQKVELSNIKECAARNARLLSAAQAGISQARAHLDRSRGAALTTYDAQGRSHAGLAAVSRTLARR